jgi:hypothetical protein
MTRWAVYVHNPDGDMGDGVMVGPFYDVDKAEAKAEAIRKREGMYGDPIECIVLRVRPGNTSARRVADEVQYAR